MGQFGWIVFGVGVLYPFVLSFLLIGGRVKGR